MNEFIELILTETRKILGENYKVLSKQVDKKNNTHYESIIILDNNNYSNTTPAIYLENFYQMYMDGKDIQSIAELIIDCYKEHSNVEFDVSKFMNFEIAKNYICYELVNTKENLELLREIPHREFFDLSIIYYVKVNNFMGEDEFAGITIHSEHLTKIWNVTEEDLYYYASFNTPRLLGHSLMKMTEISERVGIAYDTEYENLYILSNRYHVRGASVILYTDILTAISKAFDMNLWIIPSSVHEWIIAFDCKEVDYEFLIETILHINKHDLAKEEVLGTHPYFFNKDTLKITVNRED